MAGGASRGAGSLEMVLDVEIPVESAASSVQVEFVGLPRAWAGMPGRSVEASRLADVLACLEAEVPALAGRCIAEGQLRRGFLVSVNGGRFVTDPATPLAPRDTVILLSAEAGG